MDKNESNKKATFKRLAAEVLERAGELTTLDGSEIAILIENPDKPNEYIAWPSPEVALERFMRCGKIQMPEPSYEGLTAEQIVAAKNNAEMLLYQLENGRNLRDLNLAESNTLLAYASESLKSINASIEEKKKSDNQPESSAAGDLP